MNVCVVLLAAQAMVTWPKLSVVGDWKVALEWGADRVEFDVPPGAAVRGVKPRKDCWGVWQEGPQRLDAIVRTADGRCVYRPGPEVEFLPPEPKLAAGERLAGTVWVTVKTQKLSQDDLYPVLAPRMRRHQCQWNEPPARDACPKAVKKLKSGEKLRILAWGDSCTEQLFLKPEEHWQNRFVKRLKEIYPKANIELVTHAWGGYTTRAFLEQKPGAEHNFAEKILGAEPDLVISEFVNDGNYNNYGDNPNLDVDKARKFAETTILADYETIYKAFQEKGIEWVICVPHYTRPDWMGKKSPQECDDDPRPYSKILRRFSATHKVALADAARYWGALRKSGIPYPIYFNNGINHPELGGMQFYDWALEDLFCNGGPQ